MLVYPVITMKKGDPIVHAASRLMLLGPNLTAAEDVRLGWHYSIEKHVRNRGFPPTFVFVPEDDLEVKPENSFRMAAALAAAKVIWFGWDLMERFGSRITSIVGTTLLIYS